MNLCSLPFYNEVNFDLESPLLAPHLRSSLTCFRRKPLCERMESMQASPWTAVKCCRPFVLAINFKAQYWPYSFIAVSTTVVRC